MMFLKGCGTLVLLAAAALAWLLFLGSRADTEEDLAIMRVWDVFAGFLFGVGFLLIRASRESAHEAKVFLVTSVGFVAIWVLISGSFLLWHEAVWRVRTTIPRRYLVLIQLWKVHEALEAYTKDCGAYPSQEQGLAALRGHLGARNWKGPYVEDRDLADPWGNPFQYSIRDGKVRVWSSGPDGQSGTEDDIERKSDEAEEIVKDDK